MLEGPRKPWIAVVLTLLCPGLGHLYCGRITACLVYFLISLALVPVMLAIAVAPPSNGLFTLFVAAVIVALVVLPWAVFDAWRSARRAPADFAPREYQRPAVYVLLALAGVLCPTTTSLFLRDGYLRAYVVASDSMAPSLLHGDRFLVNRARYGYRAPERGDVIAFREPGGNTTFVKRVVGLPGDRIEVRDGEVLVNGDPVAHGAGPGAAGARLFKVSAAEVWVLGDNLANSKDSRAFGPVPLADVQGPAEYRFWSATGVDRLGVIDEAPRRSDPRNDPRNDQRK